VGSWKETADTFHTSWDKECDAVQYVVSWGLKQGLCDGTCERKLVRTARSAGLPACRRRTFSGGTTGPCSAHPGHRP